MAVLATIHNLAHTCMQGLLELVLPGVCPACQAVAAEDGWLCPQCQADLLALVARTYCPRCGCSLPLGSQPRPDGCSACPATLPHYAQMVRLGPYSGPLRRIIRQIKYRSHDAAARRLGSLLATALTNQLQGIAAVDLVLPIPAHWRRRLARSYDHSRAIAKAMARHLDVPMGNELIRTRHTPPQAHLPRTRRLENVRNAFKVTSPATIAGATIALVDDVSTTGATAEEAARTLLKAGALRVIVAVIAKADPPKAYAKQEV